MLVPEPEKESAMDASGLDESLMHTISIFDIFNPMLLETEERTRLKLPQLT